MKRLKTAFGVLLGVVIIVPLFWLAWLRMGPTAVGPAEDPVVTWNRVHGGVADNAAPYYEQAVTVLKQGMLVAREPSEHWTYRGFVRGEVVPQDLVEWVDEQEACVALIRRAASCDGFWFTASRSGNGRLEMSHFIDLQGLATFLILRARVANQRRDFESLAESLVLSDSIARRVMRLPSANARMAGICCGAAAQEPMSLGPFAWPNADPDKLTKYSRSLGPLDKPYPDLTYAFVTERDDACWKHDRFVGWVVAIVIPQARYVGEVHRLFDPLIEMAGQKVEQQTDPQSPPALRYAQVASATPSEFSTPRYMAYSKIDSLHGLKYLIEADAFMVMKQRGNRTARAVFEQAQRNGGYPESLDFLAGADFAIDPYTGKPFFYRRTEDGFLLYSAGYDRDDDGGAHDRHFGVDKDGIRLWVEPVDGDYVFWPIPDSPRKNE